MIIALIIIISIIVIICIINKSNKENTETSYAQRDYQNQYNPTPKLSGHGKAKQAVLPTSITGKTNEPVKKAGHPSHNMNCERYVFSAKFSQTGRMRTNKEVIIFEGDDVFDMIRKMGYEEPITIISTEWNKPSDAQVSYLKNVGLLNQSTGLCSIDASCLLSSYETGIGIAPQGLYQYATKHKIVTSYYAPEDYLYENIWSSLDEEDKIAFFLFCIYRDRMIYIDANLDAFSQKSCIYEIASSLKTDEKFTKSMEKYDATSLMTFGESKIVGGTVYYTAGGSKNTIAYKTALAALKEKGLIPQ